MGKRVNRTQTSVSETQMAQAIMGAWRDLFGVEPAKEQVAMLLAQNALETGHRQKMWNFNVGNITTDGKGSYDFYDDLTTSEQIKPGVWEKKNLKYRAYPSLNDGVKDYLHILSSRHPKAWENILHPDPVAFSKALKQSGYYTANEAPYTKAITKLYSQFSQSDSYEKAKSDPGNPMSPTPANDNNIDTILNNFLRQVAASEKMNKKLYRQLLPKNEILIQVQATDYSNSIEFSRILCMALDEELMAKSFTYTNGNEVEVECIIHGPSDDCYETVKQLTRSLSEIFETATIKIGSMQISTQFCMNKKSSYQPISLEAASTQYRKFLLKFV